MDLLLKGVKVVALVEENPKDGIFPLKGWTG
jgi:hypothetical protein